MSEREIIIFVLGTIAGIFLIIGLNATLIYGGSYYQDTEILPSNSQVDMKKSLQRGDRVRIKIDTLENDSVSFRMIGKKMDYSMVVSRMDLTVAVPNSSEYDFIIANSQDNSIVVSYSYEVSFLHSYYLGIACLGFAAGLGIATFFRFRNEIKNKFENLLG